MCCSQKLFYSFCLFKKNKEMLLAYFYGFVLRLRLVLQTYIKIFMHKRSCFLFWHMANHQSMFTKLLRKREGKHYMQDTYNSSLGKISAQPHTIVKQICFPNGNVLFLLSFSLSKDWLHNEAWGCAEILPKFV